MPTSGRIRAGIGGWTFEPWRGAFYPPKLPQAQELAYASTHVTTIEINGTFYRTQTPATFAKWARETPDNFVFSVKAPRYAVNRRVLAEAGDAIERFFQSGPAELGEKLGPILWQFAPTKTFDARDFTAFLHLLPEKLGRRPLRHALEVRHPTFLTAEFVALARKYRTAIVYTDHTTYPAIGDVTSDFIYARLQRGRDTVETGYPKKQLKTWASRAEEWAAGHVPGDLALVTPSVEAARRPRNVFIYFIHNGKVRAPAAAMALIHQLQRSSGGGAQSRTRGAAARPL